MLLLAGLLLVPSGGPHGCGGGAEALPAPRREPVRLLCDFDEPRLVERLRTLLVDAVPVFERATGHQLPADEVLIVNLYGTLRGYQRGARSAGVSGFMEVGAVTAWSNQESFLVVQPRRDPIYLERAGWLPDLTAQLALHEAAHQFMERSGMYPTLALPTWYSEGAADHLAELALRELVFDGELRCLMLDDAHRSVVEAVSERHSIPLDQLFALTPVGVDQHFRRDLFYDQSAAVVRFLVGSGKERWGVTFQRYLDDMASHERAQSNWEALDRRAGLSDRWLELVADLPALERDWRAGLATVHTPWIERSGSSQWVGDDLLVAALAWQESGYVEATYPAPDNPRQFDCEFELLDLDGGEAFVVLHAPRQDEGGLKLTLKRDGQVALVGWRQASTSVVALTEPALREAAGLVRLRLEIEGRSVSVRVGDGQPLILETPAGYPAPGGRWGLGAWKDAVLWRGARLE